MTALYSRWMGVFASVAMAACATTARRDIPATFAAEGGGNVAPIPFVQNGNLVKLAEFDLGSLPDTAPDEMSLAIGREGRALWEARGKGTVENRMNRNHVKMSAKINATDTATRAYTVQMESQPNFSMAGTISGPEAEIKIETFPQDFDEGMQLGIDGGYLYEDGKAIAAFEWLHVPQKVWVRDGLPAWKRELVLTALSLMWLRKVDLDLSGRQKPRVPPLGKERDPAAAS